MPEKITAITLKLPYGMGKTNCYLLKNGDSFFLIDTGSSNSQNDLERELELVNCKPGDLKLIILTHGDFDHAGNVAYLRRTYGTRAAMHRADAGMVEAGNMFSGRNRGNLLIGTLAPRLFGFGKNRRFKPDIFLEDGDDLAEYGLNARTLSLPGHSRGSLGILTESSTLFCGDLLVNRDKPSLNTLIDDPAAARLSLARLKSLKIKTVYPGHGGPFTMETL